MDAPWLIVSGARPRLELTVCVEKGAEDLGDERASVYRLAVNALVILCVTLEGCIQVASEHDADLNGAKGFGDACEFHSDLHKLASEMIRQNGKR
jgi:hypothetical protein